MENLRKTGSEYEQKAAWFLQEKGYKIIEKNYRCRTGEIDLIAIHKGYLVFVEVKYRKTADSGMPVEAVNLKKQRIISKVAQNYMLKRQLEERTPVRFDVVAILGDDIMLYENAFDFCG